MIIVTSNNPTKEDQKNDPVSYDFLTKIVTIERNNRTSTKILGFWLVGSYIGL